MEQKQDKDYIHYNGKDYIPVPTETPYSCNGCALFGLGGIDCPLEPSYDEDKISCPTRAILKEYHRPISFEEEPHKAEEPVIAPFYGELKADKVMHKGGIHKQSYYSFPNGVEAEDICRYLSFNLGNVIKYICRAGRKEGNDAVTDLNKAMDYLKNEIELKKEK